MAKRKRQNTNDCWRKHYTEYYILYNTNPIKLRKVNSCDFEASAVYVPLVRPVMLLFNNIITICYGNSVGHQYTNLNTNNIDPESKHEGNIVADSTPLSDLKTRRHVFEQTLCTQLLQNRKCLCFLYIVYVYIYILTIKMSLLQSIQDNWI